MTTIFEIKDIQSVLESMDDTIFQCAHLISPKRKTLEDLKTIYDQAKFVQVEGTLILTALRNKEGLNPVEKITLAVAEKALPNAIGNAKCACDRITGLYPDFAKR